MSHVYGEWNGGRSRRVEEGELKVPFREIPLTTGETFRIYDTAGPDAVDGRLPDRRPWLATRPENFTQLRAARDGLVTDEVRFAALREGVDPDLLRSEVAAGR